MLTCGIAVDIQSIGWGPLISCKSTATIFTSAFSVGLHYKVEDVHAHRCVNNTRKVGSPELVTCSAKGGKSGEGDG